MPETMSVDEIMLVPTSNDTFHFRSLHDEDSRLKFTFLGNWPKDTENPDLHFLVTPTSYDPGITPGAHKMIYLSSAPDYLSTFLTNEGRIQPVETRKGSYLILIDEEQGKRERVLPFMLGKDRTFRLMKSGFAEKIMDAQAEIIRHQMGKPYDGDSKEKDDFTWQSKREAKDSIVKETSDIYVVLKNYFEHALNTTQPLRRTSLRPKDWFKRFIPVSDEGILGYVKDVIYWMINVE
jgi:hypothetical protein